MRALSAVLAGVVVLAACAVEDAEPDDALPADIPAAGFIELEGVDYELGLGADALTLRSTDARQFWAYQPVDEGSELGDAADAPLLVFFNGGPGVSSGMLMGFNTGRMSIDPKRTGPDRSVVDNPDSWTSLGNLLWIDARQTGFSYGLLDDPGDVQARTDAMSLASFNAYRDAADFVRVLLRFLAAHPELQDNPIVLVGESYGGTRAQLMLDMLLFPSGYADGSRRLRDPALVEEIHAHHQLVHGVAEDPAIVRAQFGRQVLIQPLLTGELQKQAAGELFEQPGSLVAQLGDELGVPFVPCSARVVECDPYRNAMDFLAEVGRAGHDYRAPTSWASELYAVVRLALNDVGTFETLLGIDALDIEHMRASQRERAWRGVKIDDELTDANLGDWPEWVGALEPWDRYFEVFNTEAKAQFGGTLAQSLELEPLDPHYGELFLSNLVWVETLITNAAFDLATHAPGIPPSLISYDQLVAGVAVDADLGRWIIDYRDDVFGGPGSRTVTVPSYQASHVVTLDASGRLRDDIAMWMR